MLPARPRGHDRVRQAQGHRLQEGHPRQQSPATAWGPMAAWAGASLWSIAMVPVRPTQGCRRPTLSPPGPPGWCRRGRLSKGQAGRGCAVDVHAKGAAQHCSALPVNYCKKRIAVSIQIQSYNPVSMLYPAHAFGGSRPMLGVAIASPTKTRRRSSGDRRPPYLPRRCTFAPLPRRRVPRTWTRRFGG